jgi:hypothetical protein
MHVWLGFTQEGSQGDVLGDGEPQPREAASRERSLRVS